MRYVPRVLETTVRRAMKTFPAILITGPRQSGKTTLLRRGWGATHRFVSLENPDTRERAIRDPIGFLDANPPPIILDEIQYVPELLSYIKTQIDEDRRPGRWLMSGSQAFAVMQGVGQSLAGRIAVLVLLPLAPEEAAGEAARSLKPDAWLKALFDRSGDGKLGGRKTLPLGKWLLRGGFPEPCLNPKVDIHLWCSSYVQTYLERDIRSMLKVGDLNTFERFVRLCAARTAQILNLSDLARDTGTSVPTAKSWLSVMQAGHQVFLLPPYFRNLGKRLIKAPKLYFIDTAMAAYLMGIRDEETLLNGPSAGALFETSVVSACLKRFLHRGETPPIHYWRSRDGLEVDLLIERNQKLYPIEIKSTATVRPAHASSIEKWRTLAGQIGQKGLLVTQTRAILPVSAGVHAVPWSMI